MRTNGKYCGYYKNLLLKIKIIISYTRFSNFPEREGNSTETNNHTAVYNTKTDDAVNTAVLVGLQLGILEENLD